MTYSFWIVALPVALAIFFAYLSLEFKKRFDYEHDKFNSAMRNHATLQKIMNT